MELKELKDLLKLLRAQGVTKFKSNGTEIELSEFAPQPKEKRQAISELDEQELSDEELIYYSAIPPIEQLDKQ
jgi:hypothetical protein